MKYRVYMDFFIDVESDSPDQAEEYIRECIPSIKISIESMGLPTPQIEIQEAEDLEENEEDMFDMSEDAFWEDFNDELEEDDEEF